MAEAATLGEAIKYPFRKWPRCYNFLWVLTIIGIPAVIGYTVRVLQELMAGRREELPKFEFWNDFSRGWLPLGYGLLMGIIIMIIAGISMWIHSLVYTIVMIILYLIMPILFIQFCEKRDIGDGFDVGRAFNIIKDNFADYLITYIKTIIVTLVFMLAIILLLVGYGANAFGSYYLFADFYVRNKK